MCRQAEGETVEQIRGRWRFVDRHNEFGENGINEIELMQEKEESVKGKYRRVEKEKYMGYIQQTHFSLLIYILLILFFPNLFACFTRHMAELY